MTVTDFKLNASSLLKAAEAKELIEVEMVFR
jgi:hypothetical protein